MEPIYLSIEPEKTGKKIKKLLDASGYTVRDVQRLMGFNNPQAIYKWLSGKSLPSIVQFAPAGGRKCVLERPLCGVQRPPAFSHLTTAFAY